MAEAHPSLPTHNPSMTLANSEPIDAVLIGAGGRGAHVYGALALEHPESIQFSAVADPDPARREFFANRHEIEPERRFSDWRDLCAQPRLARAAVNCTQDRTHLESTLALLRAGYDVLLEKPMATSAADCRLLVDESERLGRTLQVCHVLRYTPFFNTLYDIVDSGELGEIVTIDHRENVSWWHMSHSFVRGDWGNEAASTPMILAKCCHDLDILVWTMGREVKRLSSFGSLSHYRPERAPQGAPPRCTDGCPAADSCIWHAPRLYGAEPRDSWQVPIFMANRAFGSADVSPAQRMEILRTSPFGRCVFHADNDVVDRQVIAMEFDGGVTCTFTMHGHSDFEGRTMRWDGTKATLFGDFTEGRPHEFRIVRHGSTQVETIRPEAGRSGHGGGDAGLLADFVAALHGQSSRSRTSARVSLASHLIAFAAEESRRSGRVVEL